MLVIFADQLDQDVERARTDDDVLELGESRGWSAMSLRSPSARMPTSAWRVKPTVCGSVTATICITLSSRRRRTRWRTAASDSPTVSARAAYERRPSL